MLQSIVLMSFYGWQFRLLSCSKGDFKMKKIMKGLLLGTAAVASVAVLAGSSGLGGVADTITGSFTSFGKLIIATAQVAGVGFGAGAIFKFKQHKDNPTQVPIGTPFMMLVVSFLLVFLPSMFAPAGETMYGSSASAGGFAGGGVSALI
jgi:intracellular multiplication protein IcmD